MAGTDYFREYIECSELLSGGSFTAEVRMCHDFPPMSPTGSNRVVVFDDRVHLDDAWQGADYPTDTWGVLAVLRGG